MIKIQNDVINEQRRVSLKPLGTAVSDISQSVGAITKNQDTINLCLDFKAGPPPAN